MAEFTQALLGRDLDIALSLLSHDALLFYSNGVVLRRTDFAPFMSAAWKVIQDYVYTTESLTWFVDSESSAVVVYGFKWSGTARDQQVGGSGRATRVFARDGAGWVLTHEHLSAGQPPV